MSHAKVQTELTADDANLQAALKRGESSIRSYGSRVGGVLKGLVAAFAVKKVVDGLTHMARLYATQEQAERKLEAVLAATGNAAGYTAEQLKQMAAEFQKTTTYGDETALSAMGVLATFREIRGEQFRDATQAAMDMASVMGGDLQGAIVQVGKALNDPIQGMSALSRVGVSFTEQQKEQIEALQKSGDIAGAQAVILAELKSEFGGTAAAMAATFGGRVTQLWNSLGDLGESIGKMLMPAMEGLVSMVGNLASWVEALLPTLQRWWGVLAEVGNVLWDVGSRVVNAFYTGVATVFAAVETVINNFGDTVRLVLIGAAYQVVKLGNVIAHWFTKVIPDFLMWFGRNWDKIFTDLWRATRAVFSNMGTNVREFFEAVMAWLRGEGFDFKWTGLLDGFQATLDELPQIAERIPGELEKALGDETATIGAKLGREFQKNFAIHSAAIDESRKDLYGLPQKVGTEVKPAFSGPRVYDYGSKEKERAEQEKTEKGGASFEDLASLYKRIAGAAAGRPEDRTAKATEKTAEGVSKLVDIASKAKDKGVVPAVLGA